MTRAYVRIILILIPVIAVSVFVLLRESRAGDSQPPSAVNDLSASSSGVAPATQRDTIDQPGGSASRAGVGGTVNFTVRDADGNVKEAGAVSVD